MKATLDDDLTENSRIYDVVDYDGKQYTVSVLDNQVHAAGYLNQVWQWLRLTGVSMRRDRSSVDAMHHHYAMILGLSNAGLETPRVYGVADYGESSILVFHRNRMPLNATKTPCPTMIWKRSWNISPQHTIMASPIVASLRKPCPAWKTGIR